jgi:hypothetical protein
VGTGGLRLRADAQAERDLEAVVRALAGVERRMPALRDASVGRPRETGCSRGVIQGLPRASSYEVVVSDTVLAVYDFQDLLDDRYVMLDLPE